jgi:hypothetical protein
VAFKPQPAPNQAAEPTGDPWLDQRRAEHPEEFAHANGEADLAKAQREAELAAYREQNSGIITAGTQGVRGILDALLAPGALVGAGLEAAGEAWDSDTLKEIGRDYGEASSGKSAMSALSAAFGLVSGDGATVAQQNWDETGQAIDKQQEARPMLSTISRIAGTAAFGLGLGAGASATSRVGSTILANAAEGAAGGAQGAYERSEPLRDVLSSAALGGVLGGAITGAAEGVGAAARYAVKKAPNLAEAIGDNLTKFADTSAVKSVIDRDAGAWKTLMRGGEERISRVADRIRAADVLGKGDEGMLEGIQKASSEAAGDLEKLATHLDSLPEVSPNISKMEADIAEQISGLQDTGSRSAQMIARRLKGELDPLREKLALQGVDSLGNPMTMGYRDPKFGELLNFKRGLGNSIDWNSTAPLDIQMQKMWRTVSDGLSDAADAAGPGVKKMWREANEASSDFMTLEKALKNQITNRMKNRAFSPSDYGTSIGAGLATLVHTANPLAAAAASLGTAVVHKAAREGGRAAMSMLATKLARFSTRIPKVAGPEMQEVLQTLAKGKRFAESVAESAGDNPTVRQQATELANHAVAESAAGKAGTMDLSTWATKPPTPLQKVIYRGPLLSRISDDLSRAAQETAEMRPPMPQSLDVGKIAKLARDADGPAAIGSVQSIASQVAAEAPPTPTGSTIGVALRRLSGELETADVADAMAKAHDAARVIVELGETAGDEASRNFAQRAAISLQDTLGGEAFGGAGRQYQALVQGPHGALEQLSDPKAIRELLRSTTATGELPRTILEAQQRVAAAYDAAYKLAGMGRPATLGADFKRLHGMFEAAERAVTLDGKPMSALFNAAKRAGVYGAAEAHGADVSETTVSDAIDEKLDRIAPVIKDAAGIGKRGYRPENLSVPATGGAVKAMNQEDPQALYERRMKQLGGFVADPTTIPGGMYAQIGADMTGKMTQLLNDMPKPEQSLLGSVGSQLSRSDLQLANAMWEATAEPLSVFDDFARGLIDYSKVSYAWKQYPGLQQAAQAGVLDLLTQEMSQKDLDKVPSGVITQLDNLLGFGGKLSTTIDHGFAGRMTQMFQPEPNKPGPGGMLDTPKSKPTFTERLSGAAS